MSAGHPPPSALLWSSVCGTCVVDRCRPCRCLLWAEGVVSCCMLLWSLCFLVILEGWCGGVWMSGRWPRAEGTTSIWQLVASVVLAVLSFGCVGGEGLAGHDHGAGPLCWPGYIYGRSFLLSCLARLPISSISSVLAGFWCCAVWLELVTWDTGGNPSLRRGPRRRQRPRAPCSFLKALSRYRSPPVHPSFFGRKSRPLRMAMTLLRLSPS